MDLHDGAIGVYSAGEGKGTRFTLELPMSRTTAMATAQSGNLSPGTDPAATATRSASLPRPIVTTRGRTFAVTAAAAAGSNRITRDPLNDSRLSANLSAPADLNTLGCVPAAAAAAASLQPNVTIDTRLETVQQALNDQQQSLKDPSPSGSRHSSLFSPGRRHSKGSMMLRELSRKDALNPQSGSVRYSADSKRGLFLGSPLMSHNISQNHESHDASSLPHSIHVVSTAAAPENGQTTARVNVAVMKPDTVVPSTTITSSPIWDVLVVDDSALNRKMLVKTLRAAGHSCEEAGNGREGVEMVQKRSAASKTPYDVVLMDFVMPVMDGPTATRTLRTAEGYVGPVIGLTGNAMPADINHFMAHGK